MPSTTTTNHKLSAKQQKRLALATLKSARSGHRGPHHHGQLDALDDILDDTKNNDVYETMDEEQYREYVERKREREDFVVDDDGLGYHDDGDYDIMGMAAQDDELDHNPSNKRPKKATGGNALTKEALKKARRNKAAAASLTGDGAEEGGANSSTNSNKQNRTMWDFVNKGIPATAASSIAVGGGGGEGGSRFDSKKSRMTSNNKNNEDAISNDLDDLLNGLDEEDYNIGGSRGRGSGERRILSRGGGGGGSSSRHRHASQKSSLSSSQSHHNRRASLHQQQRHRDSDGRHRSGSVSKSRHSTHRRYGHDDRGDDNVEQRKEEEEDFGHHDVDFGNDDTEEINDRFGGDGSGNGGDNFPEDKHEDEDVTTDRDDEVNHEPPNSEFTTTTADDATPTRTGVITAKSSRLGRTGRLAGRLAAARAKEQEDEEKQKQLEAATAAALMEKEQEKKAKMPECGITADVTSTSFQPTSIAAASTSMGHDSSGVAMNLDKIVMVEEDVVADKTILEVDGEKDQHPNPRSYLDVYWLDAAERQGVIYLYGKVKVPIESHGKDKKKDEKEQMPKFVYQSCCVTVSNNERNLFVLPRLLPITTTANNDRGKIDENDDEKSEEEQQQQRHSIGDVYNEIKSILTPSCIPQVQGANWKAKPVTRSYAFEDPAIPRGECQYLKVVYDGKYPVPDRNVCVHGGKTFEKILGAGASNLENFLIKRQLMGPGWVRIYNPRPVSGGTVSWCKWECTIDGPKSLKRLDLVTMNGGEKVFVPPPPPVSTVSIKFKTIVNPKSHKLEIVCVSAICHSNVLIDGASDEGTKHMTQLTLVRPINLDSNNGTMAQYPRDMEKESHAMMPELGKSPNERALLSRLFAQLGTWDPDVIVSHNGWGHDVDVLLNRCVELKVSMWSKIGRRRQMKLPSASQFGNGKDWAIAQALEGRILCDTCLSAKDFLSRETTYSLTNLAKTQLKVAHVEIEPIDVPQYCKTGKHFVSLAKHTLHDAQLVQCLMFKMQVLPLTKQLTNIAGNLWGRTLKGNRAERNEYLLLHEFHQLKYLVPEKRNAKQRNEELFGGEDGGPDAAGSNNKAKYSGGLVLEPKKGLYDSFILLLDFNSLYPSLIQEYNLCFTTMDWTKSVAPSNMEDGMSGPQGDVLPPLPDESLDRGVLPRVIKTLVDRRRNVKKFMQNEKDKDKKEELNIRQLALKLTANSMYGCLGFSNSRFYAQPIAALVTAMGRETLQRTVDLAQTAIGLEVIYGDTDSIMINTRITDVNDYSKVLELGNKVKREVNKLYKTLELEIDGVFRSMLLLKKKKYAAVTISTGPNGQFVLGKEMKGLDLVRRDWCIQSKESGQYVLDQILSGDEKELVVHNIHEHLAKVAAQMRGGELPLEKYVITKGLNKHPNDYPDAKSLPHVFVAKMMLSDHKAVSVGDHIPYVITSIPDGEDGKQQDASAKKALASERARHPDEIIRSNGVLKPDVEWYLTQQILPPISRLCEPIEGTSAGILAEKLGLDSTKYNSVSVSAEEEDAIDYTPASCLPDVERFKDVEKLLMTCSGCNEEASFPGVFRIATDEGTTVCQSGLRCPNPHCRRANNWGEADRWSCVAKILNKMNATKKQQQRLYYDGLLRCDDPMCGLETRQLSVCEDCCLKPGCNGRLKSVYTESALQTQLKYFNSLFDISHALKQHRKSLQASTITEKEITESIGAKDKEVFQLLHGYASHSLNKSGYNWVSGQFFQTLFGLQRQ